MPIKHSRALPYFLLIVAALFQHICLADAQAVNGPGDNSVILFKQQVPYSQESTIRDSIKQECALNEAMVTSIQKYAREFSKFPGVFRFNVSDQIKLRVISCYQER